MQIAMSGNRLTNDPVAITQSMNESLGPGYYVLTRYVPDRAVVSGDPRMTTQGIAAGKCANDLIDIDSDLLGITRKAGTAMYDPARDMVACESPPLATAQAATATDYDPEDCRLSNPPSTLRGTGINRWEWLCADPQDTALSPIGVPADVRSMVKDTHRPLVETMVADRVSPAPSPAAGGDDAHAASVGVGLDIRAAVANLPPVQTVRHWRDAREIRKIMDARAPF
jgi:hypothetical protein